MKISEVCCRTGLSKRSIRLYAERGLITPEAASGDARQRVSYTEQNVEALRAIASLRRAMFSIEQIKHMLDDPGAIPAVWEQYRGSLRELASLVTALEAQVERADAERFESIFDVAASLESAAQAMPLPKADINPRFARFDTEEFAESRDAREKSRLQYAPRRYMNVPGAGVSPGFFSSSPQFANLGMRVFEFLPKKRLTRILIIALCLVLIASVAAVAVPPALERRAFEKEFEELYSECRVTYSGAEYIPQPEYTESLKNRYKPQGALTENGDPGVDGGPYLGCELYAARGDTARVYILVEYAGREGYILCTAAD